MEMKSQTEKENKHTNNKHTQSNCQHFCFVF